MKNETNIEKLAKLSRISVSEEEQKELKDDINSILSYIEQIQDISSEMSLKMPEHHNIMRDDIEPHEAGEYTKDLLNEAPFVEDDYLQVKKIINQD